MSDKRTDIHQDASNSANVTQIGYQQIVNQYGSDAPRIRDYLTEVVNKFGPLRQRYIDLEGSAPAPARSDDPFADMFLITPVMRLEGQEEPVPSVQAALQEHDRLVMLGDPGAGKTTSLKVLLANAAERCLKDAGTHPLPLLLELGAWPDSVPDLSAYVERHLKASLPLGSKLLLLLDGLNEIGGERRVEKLDSIRAYLGGFKLARVVMTCREKDYPEELDEQFKLPKLTVAPLDDERVRRLICAYLPDEAQAEALWKAIQPEYKWESERALLELARNPYLLTILAWIYQQNGSLPESAAQLFGQMVELRYDHEAKKAIPPFTFEQFTRALGDLAFEMIDQDKGTSADKVWIRKHVLHFFGPRFLCRWRFLRPAQKRQADALIRFGEACSILVDGGSAARFYHQLMQEYFAARALDWRGNAAALARVDSERWLETLFTRAGMGEAARGQVIGAYIAAVKNGCWDARSAAAEALVEIGSPAVEPLIAALRDRDKYLRCVAAEALGNIGDAHAIAPLIAALKDIDDDVRYVAAEALDMIGDARAVEPLIAALKEEDECVSSAAASALGQIKDARAIAPLIAALKGKVDYVRSAAARALGEIGDACAVEPLIVALKHGYGYTDVRRAAAEALGKIGDARAFEPLITALGDRMADVRYAAVKALGQIKDARAVPALIERLSDMENLFPWSDERVCDAAAESLRSIGTPEALAALREHGFETDLIAGDLE